MIPYLLAIAGGYLIGQSQRDKISFAKGGKINSLIEEIKDNIEYLEILPDAPDENASSEEAISYENLVGILKKHDLTPEGIGIEEDHVQLLLTSEEDEIECVTIADLEKILSRHFGKKVDLSEDEKYADGGEVRNWRVMYFKAIPTRGGEKMMVMSDQDTMTGTLDGISDEVKKEVQTEGYEYAQILDQKEKVAGKKITK